MKDWVNPNRDTILEDMTMKVCRCVYPEFDIVDYRYIMALIIKQVRKTIKYK